MCGAGWAQGRRPTWGGIVAAGLGLLLSQAVAQPLVPDAAVEPVGTVADQPATVVAPAAAASAPRAAPAWTLIIVAPKPLDQLLNTYLDLARYQHEVRINGSASRSGDSPAANTVAITAGELRRLVAVAPVQAKRLLETEGYVSAQVRSSVDEGPPVVVRLQVDPGPRTRVSDVTLLFAGELETEFAKRSPHAVNTQAEVRRNWSLPAGSPFRQADWTAAKNAALARLRAQGYPSAGWGRTSAHIDVPQHQVQLFALADSGPLFRFGTVQIDGLRYVPESGVRHVLPFAPGDIYTDQAVFEYQERLQKIGAFESVSVSVDADPALAQAAPVTVQLRELPKRQATLGIGVSSNTGPRVSTEYTHRALFGWPWQAKGSLELGRERSNVQTDFVSYPLEGRRRNLLSASATQLEAAGTDTSSQRVRVGRSRDGDAIERTLYVEWQHATVRIGSLISEASSITGNHEWVWRRLDNVLLPTRGLAASIEAGIGRSYAARPADGVFTRQLGRAVVYVPLPGNWFATLRAEGGSVQAAADVGVPDTLLFRAGGDESVRGYGYRALGPVKDGVPLGGRAMVTSSIEVARPISKRLAAWWLAAFVDAGDAARTPADLDLQLGYGVGVRWRSPVGPLRLDLAYGQALHELRLHFSVGTTF